MEEPSSANQGSAAGAESLLEGSPDRPGIIAPITVATTINPITIRIMASGLTRGW